MLLYSFPAIVVRTPFLVYSYQDMRDIVYFMNLTISTKSSLARGENECVQTTTVSQRSQRSAKVSTCRNEWAAGRGVFPGRTTNTTLSPARYRHPSTPSTKYQTFKPQHRLIGKRTRMSSALTWSLTCIPSGFRFFVHICAESYLCTILHTEGEGNFPIAAFLSFAPAHK